jgi:SpoIID/LytB domain protein
MILAGDNRSRICFEIPEDGYAISSGQEDRAESLLARRQMSVEASSGRLTLDAHNFARSGFSILRLMPPFAMTPKQSRMGVLVHNVVAGRGFHWCRTIDQTLSGVLEFRAHGSNVVLINELPLEEYLLGVITAEMSGNCPIEYLKAQSVVSRSWLLASSRRAHAGEQFTWCNDDCCQRYQGTGGWTPAAINALASTRGDVLMNASGEVCWACYSKNSGGITEDPESVWGKGVPGLCAHYDGPLSEFSTRFFPVCKENVREYIDGEWLETTHLYASPNVVPGDQLRRCLGRVDDGMSRFRWHVEVSQEELRNSLIAPGDDPDLDTVLDIEPGKRGRSGRLEEITLTFGTKTGGRTKRRIEREYKIRKALHRNFLYSSAFVIELAKNRKGIITRAAFKGAGWGHGAGLCQIGALGRANLGQSYEEILAAYYDQVTLLQIYK